MGDEFEDDFLDAGFLNEPEPMMPRENPILYNQGLPAGTINTNKTPTLKDAEQETIEEKGAEAESESILEDEEEKNSLIGGIVLGVKKQLDYDGDGAVEFSDFGKAVGDGVKYTGEVVREGTGLNEIGRGLERQTQNALLIAGAVAVAFIYFK